MFITTTFHLNTSHRHILPSGRVRHHQNASVGARTTTTPGYEEQQHGHQHTPHLPFRCDDDVAPVPRHLVMLLALAATTTLSVPDNDDGARVSY